MWRRFTREGFTAPPCCQYCQPQDLVLPMLLPQVLYTAVARVKVGVAKVGVAVVVKAEVEAARAKVVVALYLLLPAPQFHQRPHLNQESCCCCRRSSLQVMPLWRCCLWKRRSYTDDRKRAAEGDRKLPADDGRRRRLGTTGGVGSHKST